MLSRRRTQLWFSKQTETSSGEIWIGDGVNGIDYRRPNSLKPVDCHRTCDASVADDGVNLGDGGEKLLGGCPYGAERSEVELYCMEGDSGTVNRSGARFALDMLLEAGNGVFTLLCGAGGDDQLQELGDWSGGEEFVG